MDKRIQIAEIATAHGIKGYVKLRIFAEDETLVENKPLFTGEDTNNTLILKIKNPMKGDWIAEVKGVTDRNAAEKLRGAKLYIDRASLPDANDGEYYVEDLKGFRVIDKDGKEIGAVTNIVNFGASDLIDIKPQSGASFYIPFTDNTVIDVNLDKNTVTIDMPEIV